MHAYPFERAEEMLFAMSIWNVMKTLQEVDTRMFSGKRVSRNFTRFSTG